ncbi:MAG: hypothetical protein ACOZAA_12260 [Pseudomonadota bacterium]
MARVFLVAALFLLPACATLGGVENAPDRKTAAELIRQDLECRDVAGAEHCDPGAQPHAVELADFDCESLPLRSAIRERARALCVYSGVLVRVNGAREPISSGEREFSLLELTPGARVPKREWAIIRKQTPPKA